MPMRFDNSFTRQGNSKSIARQQYEAPKGPIEEKLADIWRELLNIDCISRNDNFFALGG